MNSNIATPNTGLGFTNIGLGFRGSYIGIFIDGKMATETIDNTKMIEKTIKKGNILRGVTFPYDVHLQSAGAIAANKSAIDIDGKNKLTVRRGFNFVVLNTDFKVLKTAYFDTYDDCATGEINE